MSRYEDDWSWKPDSQTTASVVKKVTTKRAKKNQRIAVKKKAQRFSDSRT